MKIQIILFFALFWSTTIFASTNKIPLPEHPRPDFQRIEWQNLNGSWDFEFDADDKGLAENWFEGSKKFSKEINVPSRGVQSFLV